MPLAVVTFPIVERIPLVGEAAISPHGIGIAVGFVLAAYLFAWVGDRRGLRDDDHEVATQDVAQEIVVRAAFGAIVVGRLAFVLTHLDQYTGDLGAVVSILRVTDGGLSFLGGVTGALLVCVPWIRRQGFSTPRVLDAAAPAVALGLVCGRLGDLAIGDHIGAPSGDVLREDRRWWGLTGSQWTLLLAAVGVVRWLVRRRATGPAPVAVDAPPDAGPG